MKVFSLMMAMVLASSVYASNGGDPKDPLVKITGSLNPEFKTALTKKEFDAIKAGLNGLGDLKPIEIDINDLMFEEDKPAIKLASQAVSDVFVEATKKLVVIQVLAYRYAAIVQTSSMASYLSTLSTSYKSESEQLYHQMIEAFTKDSINPFNEAMKLCKSEVCVGRIAYAQKEMMDFGYQINQGLCIGCQEHVALPKLESDIAKYAVAESFKQIQNTAKTDGESLVAQNFAALSSQTDKDTDLSMIINSGVKQAQQNQVFYSLAPFAVSKKEVSALYKKQKQFVDGMIVLKVNELAKPNFDGSNNDINSDWFINGSINHKMLDIVYFEEVRKPQLNYKGDFWNYLANEGTKGIGRCLIVDRVKYYNHGVDKHRFYVYIDYNLIQYPDGREEVKYSFMDSFHANNYCQFCEDDWYVRKSRTLAAEKLYELLKAGRCSKN